MRLRWRPITSSPIIMGWNRGAIRGARLARHNPCFRAHSRLSLRCITPAPQPMYCIAAAQLAGGKLAQAVPYQDEVEFIQGNSSTCWAKQMVPLRLLKSTRLPRTSSNTAAGGRIPVSAAPSAANALNQPLNVEEAKFAGEGEFFFVPFVSPTLGEAGANKPWLQELPDPTTTVMWNTWVEMNPETAHELHIENDDVVKIISEAGEVEAAVYLYPAIHPEVIAMPFGQGHTAYGRYAQGRGSNPGGCPGSAFQRSRRSRLRRHEGRRSKRRAENKSYPALKAASVCMAKVS